MADIAAADVTHTILKQRKMSGNPSRKMNLVRLAFGDGSLTVPAGGIPLSKGKMGCPVVIESLKVVDQGTSGYVFNYDQSAEKLVVLFADYDAVADGALIQASTVAIAAQTLEVEVIGY
jgi:hypothetical protein